MEKMALATLAGILAGGILSAVAAGEDKLLVPSISVTGAGEAAAKPDLAEIHVGVVSQAGTAEVALRNNTESMAKLLKVISSRQIADKDVQTSNFNVSPQYRQQNGRQQPEIAGYQVTNQVRVKVRKLPDLGAVLDEVVREGANQIHGIQFTVADSAPLLDEARRKAVADAQRKAKLYADAVNRKLGKVLLIQEEGSAIRPPQPVGYGVRAAMAAAVPIAAGEQEVQARISITFSLD